MEIGSSDKSIHYNNAERSNKVSQTIYRNYIYKWVFNIACMRGIVVGANTREKEKENYDNIFSYDQRKTISFIT